MGRVTFALVGAVLALGAAACGPAAPAGGGGCVDLTAAPAVRVEIADFRYVPACFTMRAAQRLVVTNDDGTDHTFTLRGTGVDIAIAGSARAEAGPLPVDPGAYELICRYHPDMRGTVTLG